MAPVCGFVPPYLVRRLAEHEQRDRGLPAANRTRRIDAGLRERRYQRPRAPAVPTDADGTKTVYSAENTETLPGTRARGDDEPPSGDITVDESYDATGQVHTMFVTEFGHDSVDGAGSTVAVTVHYGVDYANAFWNGEQLVFGDGDGTVFERFTKPPDVLFHEFVHGVTQFTTSLTYEGQPGAINESLSDCFAAMCKQRALGQAAGEADWLIGEGLFRSGVQATALRSMKEPGTAYDDPRLGKDPQVGSMADYVETTEDNGGVHINSGIPNRAFCLAATAIGGNSWQQPGQIWFTAMTGGGVTADTDFVGFARATTDAATSLFGDDSPQARAVRDAWSAVGVSTDAAGRRTGGTVAVRRTGGFAGVVVENEVDLATSPDARELSDLLDRTDLDALGTPTPQPDRFVYRLRVDDRTVEVAEQDLTPDLQRFVDLVLGR